MPVHPPPTYAELAAWAGPGRVTRPTAADIAGWDLPDRDRRALLDSGVPLLDQIVDAVVFRSDPPWYRIAEQRLDEHEPWAFVIEPGTGRVLERPAGRNPERFVNSSVCQWLRSVHLVGTLLAASTALAHWDESEAGEEAALEELADVLAQIKRLDPAAFGDGYHSRYYWPAVLDRWLY